MFGINHYFYAELYKGIIKKQYNEALSHKKLYKINLGPVLQHE